MDSMGSRILCGICGRGSILCGIYILEHLFSKDGLRYYPESENYLEWHFNPLKIVIVPNKEK